MFYWKQWLSQNSWRWWFYELQGSSRKFCVFFVPEQWLIETGSHSTWFLAHNFVLHLLIVWCLSIVIIHESKAEDRLHVQIDPAFSPFQFEAVWLFQKCNSVHLFLQTDSLKHKLSVTLPLSVFSFSYKPSISSKFRWIDLLS